MNSHDPKYEVGDHLLFEEKDYWGIVILIRPGFGTRSNEYFVDLYPGSIGFWDSLRVTGPDGIVRDYIGNWLEEERLKPKPQKPIPEEYDFRTYE